MSGAFLLTVFRMKTLYVDMGDAKPFSEDIVKLYEAKLKQAELEGINVRVLLLVNPHNPTGEEASLYLFRFAKNKK